MDTKPDQLNSKTVWFDAVLENAPINIYLKAPDGTFLWVNQKFAETFGKPAEEFIGKTAEDHLAGGNLSLANQHDHRVLTTGEAETQEEVYLGRIYQVLKCPITDSTGDIIGLVGFDTDITELRETEAKLREQTLQLEQMIESRTQDLRRSEKQFRDLIEGSIQGMYITTGGSRIRFANAKAAQIYGYDTAEDLVALGSAERLFPPDELDRVIGYRVARQNGDEVPDSYETVGLRKDRSRIWLEYFVTHTEWEGEPAWQITLVDISGRKTLQEQLLRSQRLEAVGQLAGGIAHDFNNLLGVIMGNAEILDGSVPADESDTDHVEAIKQAVERGASLTSRLLSFSCQQTLTPTTMSISARIDGLADMLHRALGETIKLKIEHDASLWPARIDASQLDHALLNLAINARDAMPQGGVLTVATRNVSLKDGDVATFEEFTPGDYVLITVSDTGTGMARETVEKAFEPFFTTKDVGVGTGLGLSMTYGFVKQSNGHVTLKSTPHQGTVISLYLPRSKKRLESSSNRSTTDDVPPGTEIILVVEDNEDVRHISANALRNRGYSVIEAENGSEAIQHLKNGQAIDLLFTDVILPGGMNGVDIATEARRLQQGIKVLFTTGYAENAVMHDGQLDPATTLLVKPYRRDELLKRIRTILESTAD